VNSGSRLLRAAIAALALAAFAPAAEASAAELSAEVSCRAEPNTRRVLCSLSLVPEPGRRVVWSDALVLRAPPASPPLRARVTSRRDSPERLIVSFVLGDAAGRVELLARAVACPLTESGTCRAVTLPLSVELPVLASP
jgi:hypothetical protein